MKIRQVLTIVFLLLLCAGVVSGLAEQQTMPPPPHHRMGPPPTAAVCTDGKYLFVVIGPKIHVYTVPDLTLKNTAELPRPTPPGKK
ncbi:MAG: hypothetical protein ACOZF2_19245 [Thermodesulfobacteriota bacterium]